MVIQDQDRKRGETVIWNAFALWQLLVAFCVQQHFYKMYCYANCTCYMYVLTCVKTDGVKTDWHYNSNTFLSHYSMSYPIWHESTVCHVNVKDCQLSLQLLTSATMLPKQQFYFCSVDRNFICQIKLIALHILKLLHTFTKQNYLLKNRQKTPTQSAQ